MSGTYQPEFLPSTEEIRVTFADEITSLNGIVTDTFDDGRHLFVRAVFATEAEVRRGDSIKAGIAVRATASEILVHPYTYRMVCTNGAIAAHALESRRISHVLVGGRSFHDREEVIALRNAITAIEWPDDELKVFATLRGPFFALTDATFQQIRNHGIVVTVRSAAKEPGPYQMRAAVEDLSSKRVGSAAQFLEVPQVGGGHLAVSGLLLKGVTAAESSQIGEAPKPDAPAGLVDGVLLEPEVRVLSPGDHAVYAFEIYDGLKDANPDLQLSTAVIRDGKVVYQSPFTPVTAAPKSGGRMRAIPVAGTLDLAPDMPAGPYTLEVTVRPANARKAERKQWLDFEIRR